jgi:carbon monoxide dehydrogenase subunit G
MILDQTVTIPAPSDKVWDFMLNIPAVGRCVPGADSVEQVDENEYKGTIKQRVGPIKVQLDGRLTLVEQDRDAMRAVMSAQGFDHRVSSKVNAKMTMTLRPLGDEETELNVHTDAALFGKLGEFGQAVAQRKANQVITQFAQNLSRELTRNGVAPEGEPAKRKEAEPIGMANGAQRPSPRPEQAVPADRGLLGLDIQGGGTAARWALLGLAGLGASIVAVWVLGRGRAPGAQSVPYPTHGWLREPAAQAVYRTGRPGVEFSVRAEWP